MLEITVLPNFSLDDPFMIASSHWTSTETSFRHLAPMGPSAVTLKTTSERSGGTGVGTRTKFQLVDSNGVRFAEFTDGPKHVELWDMATTNKYASFVALTLPKTKLGLSVLQGEDHPKVASGLARSGHFAYAELNLKYTFRTSSANVDDTIRSVAEEIVNFIAAVAPLPALIKLPRESEAMVGDQRFMPIYEAVADNHAGLLVANTWRALVPPSRCQRGVEGRSGVIAGEHLFLSTYGMLRAIQQHVRAAGLNIPVVATGGVADLPGIIDLFAAGASAVQLCTVLDVRSVHYGNVLRQQLSRLLQKIGVGFPEMLRVLRADENEWKRFGQLARELSAKPPTAFQWFVAAPSADRYVSNALREEAEGIGAPAPRSTTKVDGARTAVLCGNALTYHLGLFCGSQWQMQRANTPEWSTASVVAKLVQQRKFTYDYLVLQRSAIKQLVQASGEVPGQAPIEIGVVGRAIHHLMAACAGLDEVRTVYHYDGSTSRDAFGKLLAELKHPIEDRQLDGPVFSSLIGAWEPGWAILVKSPLADIYGSMVPEEFRGEWHSVWQATEELVLVASSESITTRGREEAEGVLAAMQAEVASIHANPGEAVRSLLAHRFLVYLAQLVFSND